MPDAVTMRILLEYVPSIAIAIGVATIYYKLIKFFEEIKAMIAGNTEDITTLKQIHVERHPDDAYRIYGPKKDNHESR